MAEPNLRRRQIADRLRDGPLYKRSFHAVRGTLEAMLLDGEIKAVRPQGGIARNMVALTELGRQRLVDWREPVKETN